MYRRVDIFLKGTHMSSVYSHNSLMHDSSISVKENVTKTCVYISFFKAEILGRFCLRYAYMRRTVKYQINNNMRVRKSFFISACGVVVAVLKW